jgi:hypothetical protein
MEEPIMVPLWTFDSQEKLERFAAVLDSNGIAHETQSKKKQADQAKGGVTIAVEEDDYETARKLLMKHRKRRTSADLR